MSKWLASALLFLLIGISGEAVAQGKTGQTAQCPLITHLKFIEGTTYTLSTTDFCWMVVFTNPGGISVSLPAPGLIFAPGFVTTLLSLGGGVVTMSGLQDDAGKVHQINMLPSLTLLAGQGAALSVQEDLNWYAFTSGGESAVTAFCLATGTGMNDCLGTGTGVNDVLALAGGGGPPAAPFCLAVGSGEGDCLAPGTGGNDVLALE